MAKRNPTQVWRVAGPEGQRRGLTEPGRPEERRLRRESGGAGLGPRTGRVPPGQAKDRKSERPKKQLSLNATGSTRSQAPRNLRKRKRPRSKDQGARVRARSTLGRGAPGAGAKEAPRRPPLRAARAGGQSAGSPGSPSPWERTPGTAGGPRAGSQEGHTPSHSRATAIARRDGK